MARPSSRAVYAGRGFGLHAGFRSSITVRSRLLSSLHHIRSAVFQAQCNSLFQRQLALDHYLSIPLFQIRMTGEDVIHTLTNPLDTFGTPLSQCFSWSFAENNASGDVVRSAAEYATSSFASLTFGSGAVPV
jgi:hypothetical protein